VKPYLTKLWVGNHRWVYIRTRRKFRYRTIRLGPRWAGIVSYTRSDYE
jgi:hypothetical protein